MYCTLHAKSFLWLSWWVEYCSVSPNLTPDVQASIPVWREFNAVSQELCEWLDHAHLQLTSDLMQPGNAVITETSLRNVEVGE